MRGRETKKMSGTGGETGKVEHKSPSGFFDYQQTAPKSPVMGFTISLDYARVRRQRRDSGDV